MKKILLYLIFIITYTFLFWIISLSFLDSQNSAVITGFTINFLLLIILLFLGILISKLIFTISSQNKKTIKLSHLNFEKKDLLKNIKKSIFLLAIFYTISYLCVFYYNDIIFGFLPCNLGTINSCKYISKIYFLSLPICAFEIVFLEYCIFLKSYQQIALIKCIKLAVFSTVTALLTNYFNYNGFLYSKLVTDTIFFIYYYYQIKNIIWLCSKNYKLKN